MQRVYFRLQSSDFDKDSAAVPLLVAIVLRNIPFVALSGRSPTTPYRAPLPSHQNEVSVARAVRAFPAMWGTKPHVSLFSQSVQ